MRLFWGMLKRDLRLFLRGLGPALILTCLLGICCVVAGLAASKGAERQTEPVKVALVDNEDSVLSRMGISMVTDQSYMSSLMEIAQVTDLDEALKGMEDGTYEAVISLPAGYMEDIMHGVSCTGTIYISDKLTGEAELIEAISDFGARLLTAGQLGVFAGERVIAENELGEEIHAQFLDATNSKLITFALDAYDTVFTFEVLPYGDTGISMVQYYGVCWVALLLFVVGLFFPQLYITDCKCSIYARLKTYGMNRFEFMNGKVLYPTLFRFALCMGLLFGISSSGIVFWETDAFSINNILVMAAISLYVSILTSNLAVSLSKKGGWSVAILSLSAVCLFMAGGLVPRTMLPEILPKLAMYTPFGPVMTALIMMLGGNGDINKALCVSGVYMMVSIIMAWKLLRTLPKSSEEVRL